jgi:hypothetical protein
MKRPFFIAGPRHLPDRRVFAAHRRTFVKSPDEFPFFS